MYHLSLREKMKMWNFLGLLRSRLLHWSLLVKLLSHYGGCRTYRRHQELVCTFSQSGARWIIANAILRIGDFCAVHGAESYAEREVACVANRGG